MRILIVQLLRLGDVVMSAPVIEGFRRRYPDAEIDLLINDQCRSIAPLLPEIGEVRIFPRSSLQRGLGEAAFPFFYSYDLVEKLVEELNGRGYDLLVNLTHNRLSGRLCDLIAAKEKRGLALAPGRPAHFGSRWFEHLNGQEDLPGIRYHHTDIFRFGSGLADGYPVYGLRETELGAEEARRLVGDLTGFIALQPLTSDVKKNWGLDRFARLLKGLEDGFPGLARVVLAAPNEEPRLREWLQASGMADRARLAVCSLEGAFSILKRARFLITLDTSIKHLAAAAETPLIELVLGSSDEQATGAYCADALILRSRESCAPCAHSRDCHRSEHFCSAGIEARAVAEAARFYAAGDWDGLRAWAGRQAGLSALRTRFSARGVWSAEDLALRSEKTLGGMMEKVGWKLHLDFIDGRESSPGSECLVLAEELKRRSGPRRGLEDLANYRRELASVRERIDRLDDEFRRFFLRGQSEIEFAEFQRRIREAIDLLPEDLSSYRAQLVRCLAERPGFIDLKRIRTSLAAAKEKCRSDGKLAEQTQQNLEGVK